MLNLVPVLLMLMFAGHAPTESGWAIMLSGTSSERLICSADWRSLSDDQKAALSLRSHLHALQVVREIGKFSVAEPELSIAPVQSPKPEVPSGITAQLTEGHQTSGKLRDGPTV